MKPRIIILFTVVILLMSGCFIKSLYPFYTQKDIVFDPAIIGTWLDADSSTWKIKQQMKGFPGPSGPDSSYQVEIIEKDSSIGSFNAHLFRLNNQFYLDFFPSGKIGSNDIVEENLVLTHSLAKTEYNKNTITIKWFNEVWLEKLLNENKIRIRHEKLADNGEESNYLLTASTEELQKFIIKYGNDPQAFKAIWEANPKDQDEKALIFTLKKISNDVN